MEVEDEVEVDVEVLVLVVDDDVLEEVVVHVKLTSITVSNSAMLLDD